MNLINTTTMVLDIESMAQSSKEEEIDEASKRA